MAIIAEQEFAKKFNLPFDDTLRPGGDGGIDFTMPDGTIVDVKGRKAGKYALSLLIEEGHAGRCDVFVLAKVFLESEVVRLIGWEFSHIIREIPAKAWPREVINHALDEALLRPMNMLVHAKWLNDYN